MPTPNEIGPILQLGISDQIGSLLAIRNHHVRFAGVFLHDDQRAVPSRPLPECSSCPPGLAPARRGMAIVGRHATHAASRPDNHLGRCASACSPSNSESNSESAKPGRGFGLADGQIRECQVHAPMQEPCSSPSTWPSDPGQAAPVFFGLEFGLERLGFGWISADRPGTSQRRNLSQISDLFPFFTTANLRGALMERVMGTLSPDHASP